MLYALHEPFRQWLEPFAQAARLTVRTLQNSTLPGSELLRANNALFYRLARTYPKPSFAIEQVTAHGHVATVTEEVIATRPFCRLIHFRRHLQESAPRDPSVLVCAPLSGHHSTLLRDTIATLLTDHEVYVTDWTNARDVPLEAGTFGLADYVAYIRAFIATLGADELHVVAVCQPTVPVLAAIALDAAAQITTPRSLTLMGGPIDARRSPTQVNRFATEHDVCWFERAMIHRVPWPFLGRGRSVYPGFIQLGAFVQMNAGRHFDAYRAYWFDVFRKDAAAVAAHEQFYDEYNAVLDMDAEFYLDTVRTVFQEFRLARGTLEIDGQHVCPSAIQRTRLLTIEGDRDDISGLGQTAAAHELCSGIPEAHKRHLVASNCGHYGIFAGQRWREQIYPHVRAHVREGAS